LAGSRNAAEGQLRDDDEFPKFESSGENVFAERGDAVFVTMCNLLDVRREAAEGFFPQSADVELAAQVV
jgi:hypothetical protein